MRSLAMESVLVIEPDQSLKKKVQKALSHLDLVFADAKKSILSRIRRIRPIVILMDVHLPGDDGFRIFRSLQHHQDTRDIPILFVSRDERVFEEFGAEVDNVVTTDDFDTLEERIMALAREAQMRSAFREAFESVRGQSSGGSSELTRGEQEVLASGSDVAVDTSPNLAPLAKHAAQFHQLLASSLTTEQAAGALGINSSRVRQRLLATPPTLYGIRKGNRWLLPTFQFAKKGLVPNIEKVIAKLDGGLAPVAVENWFRLETPDLDGVCPLEWLAAGRDWRPVADLAEDL